MSDETTDGPREAARRRVLDEAGPAHATLKARWRVMEEVSRERDYQDAKWGHEVDDERNTPWMWCAYVMRYSTLWMTGSFAPLGTRAVDAFRGAMIKTAATCVAAVESVDRQRTRVGGPGGAFYE